MVFMHPSLANKLLTLMTELTKNCENTIKNGKFTIKFIKTAKSKIANITENNGMTTKFESIVIGANSPKYLQMIGTVPKQADIVIA